MTAQLADTLVFRGEKYDLIGIAGSELFSPVDYGLAPVMWHTGCYRGYVLDLAVDEGRLVLSSLAILDADCRYPEIAGIPPIIRSHRRDGIGIAEYDDLALPLDFTGRLRLGRQFVSERYVHQGFQSPWAYQSVVDLLCEDGQLVQSVDLSDELGAASGVDEVPGEDALERIRRLHSREIRG